MVTAHDKVEKNVGLLIILILLVAVVGNLAQIVPPFFMYLTPQPVTANIPLPAAAH